MRRIILLAAALSLLAAPAMAAISGSKHDLRSSGTNPFRSNNGVDEICVFCHTPHGANAAGFAPLWNRTTANATNVYSGVDVQATFDANSYNATDAPLCLSCHDGASLADNLNNPPNIGGTQTQPTFTGGNITGQGDLDTDLSNDHPIGFDYTVMNGLDSEIATFAVATSKGVQFFDGNEDMWCSSCHDVHGGIAGTPFLITTNAGSALCLACHIK